MNRIIKSQSFIEYAVLILIIILSLATMSRYIMRSINAKVNHVWADLYHPQIGVR